MASRFLLSIVREDGEPVLFYPGGKGERDLVDAITAQLLKSGVGVFDLAPVVEKGVGIFRTHKHVVEAIASGRAPAETVRQAVTDAVDAAIYGLKAEVYPI